MKAADDRLGRAYAALVEGGEDSWLFRQSLLTREATEALVGALPLSPDDRVLDVGAGTGALSLPLALRVPLGHVVGVDLDAAALRVAGELAKAAGITNLELFRADALALPFAPDSFDRACTRFVLQHQAEPMPLLQEMCRVIRPGGTVIAVDVDDGAAVSWPELPSAAAKLLAAYRQHEAAQGKDRQVGRKLYHLFRAAGLEELRVHLWPLVHTGAAGEREARYAARVLLDQVAASYAGSERVDLTDEDIRLGGQELEESYCRDGFRLQMLFVAMGTKP